MATKLQYISELAHHTTGQLTKNRENWTEYLTTSARLYKYPFDEQVMIYTQRPNAVACASYKIWNNPMNRYVKQGSKGIALIDKTNGKLGIKYVFDYSDTEGRQNTQRPFIWEFHREHEAPVMEALVDRFIVIF